MEPASAGASSNPDHVSNPAAPPAVSASPPLLVKKISSHAKTPTRGSAFAAGYDLYSARDGIIPKRGKGLVDTDISIAVGQGCCKSFQSPLFPTHPQNPGDDHIDLIMHAIDDEFLNCRTDGRIAPRSGLAVKYFIDTGAGVIDSDYRGQVRVLLFNHSETDFEVREGDRIAQLIIERICTPEVIIVEELEESLRGAGGFGSTGTG